MPISIWHNVLLVVRLCVEYCIIGSIPIALTFVSTTNPLADGAEPCEIDWWENLNVNLGISL